MSTALRQHQQLCDDIHQCVLAENRFLRQQQRAPDAALAARKRDLLQRLNESLTSLRSIPAGSIRNGNDRATLEATRARILQILQLDKENEQLLLRASLPPGHAAAPKATGASVALLQKIYARCA